MIPVIFIPPLLLVHKQTPQDPASATTVKGLYKAFAVDNKITTPGVDGKFKFNVDGKFEFTRKTMEGTLITHGSYTVENNLVQLEPTSAKEVWPNFWPKPAVGMLRPTGEVTMYGLTFTPSLIGKVFSPGLYRCEKNPAIHYFFDRNGGYKYTAPGLGMSTGEYWVDKTSDTATGKDKVMLILNILRVDGKRVNFHQRIELEEDGGFTLEKKYKYKKIEAQVASTKPV